MKPRHSRRTLLAVGAMFVLMAVLWPFSCFANKESRAIKQVGRHMDRIHDIDHACSLQKMSAADAAIAMFAQVQAIRKVSASIPDSAALKEPLQRFLNTWTSAALIEASIRDGRQFFMADVTGFYLQGLVPRRDGSKTLFPIYKP